MPKSPKSSPEVAAFLAKCRHALLPELNALRAIVARAETRLVEGIKWNAPSFRLAGAADDCLTFNLSAKDCVRLIFHRGVKQKDRKQGARLLADDGGLLAWAADDRAIATFRSRADVDAAKATLTKLVRAWLAAVGGPGLAGVRRGLEDVQAGRTMTLGEFRGRLRTRLRAANRA